MKHQLPKPKYEERKIEKPKEDRQMTRNSSQPSQIGRAGALILRRDQITSANPVDKPGEGLRNNQQQRSMDARPVQNLIAVRQGAKGYRPEEAALPPINLGRRAESPASHQEMLSQRGLALVDNYRRAE